MNKKIPVYSIDLLFLYALLALPLIYTHTFTLPVGAALLCSVYALSYIGSVLLSYTSVSNFLLPVSHATLSLLLGGTLCSLLLFININAFFLISAPIAIAGALLYLCRKDTHLHLVPQKRSLLAIAVAVFCIAVISTDEEILNQFSAIQYGFPFSIDNYFFTSIVSSIRQGTIFSAAYEANTAVNYQTLGFLLPSYFADVLHISSHQALWGLADPLYKFGALLFCYDACHYFIKDKIPAKMSYWLIPVAILLPLLLAPLHPLYIIRGDIGKFIINGMAYILPSGVITYPLSFIMFLFCIIVFSAADWSSPRITGDKVFFTVSLALLITAKAFVSLNVTVFFGVIILKRVIADKEPIKNYLGYVLAFLALSFLSFKLLMGQSQSGKSHMKYGVVAEQFAEWYGRSTKGVANNLIVIGLILFTFTLWIGIRFAGLYAAQVSGSKKLKEFVLGSAVSMIVITVFASFLRFQVVYSTGEVVSTMDFNALGFIRANFYLITIVAAIGLCNMFFQKGSNKIMIAAVTIWCALAFTSLIKRMLLPNLALYAHLDSKMHDPSAILPWYTDNYTELTTGKYNDGLIVANPDVPLSAMLAGSDLGHYWTTRSGLLYNNGNKNEYRWALYKSFLAAPQRLQLVQMKNEGVKYLISTPADSARISEISRMYPDELTRLTGTKWIYLLK